MGPAYFDKDKVGSASTSQLLLLCRHLEQHCASLALHIFSSPSLSCNALVVFLTLVPMKSHYGEPRTPGLGKHALDGYNTTQFLLDKIEPAVQYQEPLRRDPAAYN